MTDLRIHQLRHDVVLEAYWLNAPVGPGPAASLYALGDEVMRFDCLGAQRGHMHLNMKQSRGFPGGGSARIYFAEQTFEQQIDRSCFELEHNLAYALKLNASARLRRLQPTQEEIAAAARFLYTQMHELLSRLNPVSDLQSPGAQPQRQTLDETPKSGTGSTS